MALKIMAIQQISQLTLITLLTSLGVIISPINVAESFDISLAKGIAQTTENLQTEADRLYEKGIEQLGENKVEAAIESWQEALKLYQQDGDKKGQANTLRKLGDAYNLGLREYEKAIDFYQQSVTIAKEIGDQEIEARGLNNWGLIYKNLSQHEKSIEFFEQSLTLAREIDNKQIEVIFVNNLGNAYYSLGEYQKAIEYHQKSLVINKEINDVSGEADSYNNLGNVYYSLGEYQKAIEYYQKSLAISQEISYVSGQAASYNGLGNAYYSLGEYQKAIEYHQKSLAIKQEIGDVSGEANSYNNLGVAYRNLGQYQKAENYYLQAIKVYENSLRKDLTDANKISIFETQANTYNSLQDLYIAQNQPEKALEISERGRSQALIDFLSGNLPESRVPFSKEQIKEIASQKNATLVEYSLINNYVYIWVITPDGKINFRPVDLNNFNQVLDQREEETLTLSQLIEITHNKITIGVENSRNVTNNSNSLIPNSGDYIKLKNQDAELPPYRVIEIHTDTETVTVTNRQFEEKTRISIAITEIEEIVPDTTTQNQRLQQLHQLLIVPIADLLPTNPEEKVIFIPQSSLFNVPFPALQDKKGQYLIEKHTILTAPSIQVLDFTRQIKEKGIKTKDVLVVGNPTMPKVLQIIGESPSQLNPLTHAEKEARNIASRYNTQPLIGDEATEATISQLMPNARIMHFATHGILRNKPGIDSAIALTPSGDTEDKDGWLTAGEIFKMKLNAQLVVLSACETGRGRLTGEGVIGLSRSLVAAGVESLMVSLWSVDDKATGVLMGEFYEEWDKTGNKAQALRQAMLTTLKTHPEPKYWAAFTLIGEDE